MVTKSIQQIRQAVESRRSANEKKFIPQEGSENDVYVFPDDPIESPEGEYVFYIFRVRHNDNEKAMKLFDNQVVDMDEALKKHKDRVVHVARAKGSKKLIFS